MPFSFRIPPSGLAKQDLIMYIPSSSSGCGSVWLERSVRDAEAGGSNPLIPTSEITTTRYAGGLFRPYKGLLPASAWNDAGFYFIQAKCRCHPGLPPEVAAYSRGVSLSCMASCLSCCWIYFLTVASLKPTVPA